MDHTDIKKMERLVSRLKDASPIIEEIMSVSGTAGLSYGILHEGRLVHMQSFGYRDLEKKLPVDSDTIFPLCSLSKAMVATLIGNLVHEQKVTWATKVSDVLPDFRPQRTNLQETATLLDMLSMRWGMQSHNMWLQSQNNIVISQIDAMKTVNSFQSINEMGSHFNYDNWAYDLAGRVISQITGQSWGSYLHQTISKPLGLSRTGSNPLGLDKQNVSRAYTVLDNGEPHRIEDVTCSDQTVQGSAGGIRSCISDLTKYYLSYLETLHNGESEKVHPDLPRIFRQLDTITSPHIQMDAETAPGYSYCLGWARSKLPGVMGIMSNNRHALVKDAPIIGKGLHSTEFLCHGGLLAGSRTSLTIFPTSRSAVIVLTNTLGLSDSSDTVSQLLVETLFDHPERHDFVEVTKRIRAFEILAMQRIKEQLDKEQTPGTTPRDLDDYLGIYENESKTMTIEIFRDHDRLMMKIQDLQEEVYGLNHYEHDTFSWWMTRNEAASRGRLTSYDYNHYKIKFSSQESSGTIDRILWKNMPQLKDPECFHKL